MNSITTQGLKTQMDTLPQVNAPKIQIKVLTMDKMLKSIPIKVQVGAIIILTETKVAVMLDTMGLLQTIEPQRFKPVLVITRTCSL